MRGLTDAEKIARGTFRPGRARPIRRYAADASLTPDQVRLIAGFQPELDPAVRAAAVEIAKHAPWLGPVHRGLIVVYAEASVRHHVASRELERLLREPGMRAPGSGTAKAAAAYQRIIAETATLMAKAGTMLGASPKARQALGIALEG